MNRDSIILISSFYQLREISVEKGVAMNFLAKVKVIIIASYKIVSLPTKWTNVNVRWDYATTEWNNIIVGSLFRNRFFNFVSFPVGSNFYPAFRPFFLRNHLESSRVLKDSKTFQQMIFHGNGWTCVWPSLLSTCHKNRWKFNWLNRILSANYSFNSVVFVFKIIAWKSLKMRKIRFHFAEAWMKRILILNFISITLNE